VIITRHGKPVAQLARGQDRKREKIAAIIERMNRAGTQRPRVLLQGILASRHDGRKNGWPE
jgi:antitoxin (DNA-binding transcriptional repressor) of toxin-antitoxin stability system